MKEENIIERQGKRFVLYAGLLEEAHTKGLKSISTTMLQVPNSENKDTAIVHATVTMADESSFTGIGDASPQNVGRQIAPHIIRMAETRAKARALRDAINVSEAVDETDDDVPTGGEVVEMRDTPPPEKLSRMQSRLWPLVSGIWPNGPESAMATILQRAGKGLDELTDAECAPIIEWLEGKQREKEQANNG